MNKFIVALVVSCLFALCTAEVFLNGAERIEGDAESLFHDFIATYSKTYKVGSAEYNTRLANFKSNIVQINKDNAVAQSGEAVFGISKFTDMSEEEFRTTILMKNPIKTEHKDAKFANKPANLKTPVAALPTTFDWNSKGAVTPVKDQEQCGSCWAFSATEAIESAWILAGKATNETVDLAPQQIVDCDNSDAGCDGGETYNAYEYVISAGGLESNTSYPYKGVDGACKFNKNKVVASITGYKKANSFLNEDEMQTNFVNWGPLSICVDAAKWQNYQSGIMTRLQCSFINLLDHCVQVTAYNAAGSVPYWVVRNSWNTDWGVQGYIWLEMGKDTCGIAHEPTWPTVA